MLEVRGCGAYYAYVSNPRARQMPKEPLYVDFISKKARALQERGEPYIITLRECSSVSRL